MWKDDCDDEMIFRFPASQLFNFLTFFFYIFLLIRLESCVSPPPYPPQLFSLFSADMSSLGGQLQAVGCLTPPFAIPAGQPAVQAAVQAAAVPPSASTSPGALAGTGPGKARSSMNLSMISGR